MEWPNAGWMDGCPCEDAFYAGTHIASCELTSSPAAAASGRGGSNPAPMPTRSGTGPSPSTTADSEAGIFMLVYASFAVASFLALVIVSWWWKREGQRRRRDEAIAAELANPWNVMARMRAGEHGGGGSRAGGNDGTNASNGTKHSSRSTVVRGSMWGMYFENPTGSVVFGKELAVLDDPDAVAYVYGEDADEEKGEKNKNDENDSRETPWEETRVTLDQHDPSDVAVRVYDGEDTRRHGARLAGAQLERLSSGTTSADLSSTSSSEMAGEGMDTERSGSFGSSRSLGSLTRGNDSSSDDNSRGYRDRRAGRLCLIAHTHSPRSASPTRKLICQTRAKTLGRGEAGPRVSGRRRCGGTATRTRTRKPRDSRWRVDTRVGVKRTPHPELILPNGAKVLKS